MLENLRAFYNKVFFFQRKGKDYPIYSPSILCKINPRNPGCGKTKNQNGNRANQNQSRASLNQNRASLNQNRANQNQNGNRAGVAGSIKSQGPGFPKKVKSSFRLVFL